MRIRRSVNISNASVFHLVLVTMTALVRHVITEDCGHEELVQCTRPLQVLSVTSELSFVTKKVELDKLCPFDAPCMRHVKKDYEVCAVQYQSTMTKIGQTVATTTTTTVASSIYPKIPTHPAAVLSNGGGQYYGSDMDQHRHHYKRQQEHSGSVHPNSTNSIEDAGKNRLEKVC